MYVFKFVLYGLNVKIYGNQLEINNKIYKILTVNSI